MSTKTNKTIMPELIYILNIPLLFNWFKTNYISDAKDNE